MKCTFWQTNAMRTKTSAECHWKFYQLLNSNVIGAIRMLREILRQTSKSYLRQYYSVRTYGDFKNVNFHSACFGISNYFFQSDFRFVENGNENCIGNFGSRHRRNGDCHYCRCFASSRCKYNSICRIHRLKTCLAFRSLLISFDFNLRLARLKWLSAAWTMDQLFARVT